MSHQCKQLKSQQSELPGVNNRHNCPQASKQTNKQTTIQTLQSAEKSLC